MVEDAQGRLVLLNVTTGTWHLLNRTGAAFYQQLSEVADINLATETLIALHRGVPTERIRRDVDELVDALVRRGLIEITDDHRREAAGVLVALVDDHQPASRRYRLAAAVSFPVAILLLKLPFRHVARLVGWLNRAKPEASRRFALSVLTAARHAGRRYPGRVACLELSLTAVLTAALIGRKVNWCLGFGVDPYTFHAWIEVSGVPVVHPMDEPVSPSYRRVFRT